ncbi:MAG TPA: rod shape-determining protein MreC [Candidatus Saccharimonadia bacterium]|nr:rod shape-determining protein MreC [Candidatus Saccharimonadia bacterium]
MNRSKANRRIYLAVGIGGALAVAGLLGWLGPLRWVYDHTVVPVSSGLATAGSTASEAMSNLGQIRQLAADNQRLQRENADLRQRLAADAETRRDNDLLRNQLGLEVAGTPQQVAAEVVAFQPDSYRQFVTINKGSSSGLKPGMAAMSQGVLVGTLSDVQAGTAKIMLVADPEFKLAAKDQDTNALGILQGQLGNGLIMDKIGQTDTVKPGDTITTSGLGGLVPAGLFIGQVQAVNAPENEIFQSAQISSPLQINHLRFVFVVLSQ